MKIFHRFPLPVILTLAFMAVLGWQSKPWKNEWQRWAEATPQQRNFIAHRWVENGTLEGWTRQKVVENLGTPISPELPMSYDLGVQRDSLFPIDPEFLVIHFNSEDRVASAEISHP